MKKSVSLKLVVFSLLLVAASISYSEPKIEAGTGPNSTVAGVGNTASKEKSSAFGYNNTASGRESSAFGFGNIASKISSSAFGFQNNASGENSSAFGTQYKVTGNASGAFGVGNATWNRTTQKYDYDYINEGKNSYMFGNYNKIAAGTE